MRSAGHRTRAGRLHPNRQIELDTRMATALVATIGEQSGKRLVSRMFSPSSARSTEPRLASADPFGPAVRHAELVELDPHGAIREQRRRTVKGEGRTRERQLPEPRPSAAANGVAVRSPTKGKRSCARGRSRSTLSTSTISKRTLSNKAHATATSASRC